LGENILDHVKSGINDQPNFGIKPFVAMLGAPIRKIAYPDRQTGGWPVPTEYAE
jgi:hypothetical protein